MEHQVPIRNVFRMLAYVLPPLSGGGFALLKEEEMRNYQDLLALILAEGMSSLVRRGMARGYVPMGMEGTRPRGRILLAPSMGLQARGSRSLAYEADEFLEDTVPNRILREAALLLLRDKGTGEEGKRKLRIASSPFLSLTPLPIASIDFRTLSFHRGDGIYPLLLFIARLVLDGSIPMEEGDSRAEELEHQMKMERLYEEFLRAWFRKERPDLFEPRRKIPWAFDSDPDASSKTLLPRMQGDLILRNKDSVLVVDAKLYSHALTVYHGKEIFHSAHLYQILSYVRNGKWGDNNQVDGLLLYARTREEKEAKGDFRIGGHHIHIRSLDLSGEWESVEKTLKEVASLVGGGGSPSTARA